jgi:hypothetical protein
VVPRVRRSAYVQEVDALFEEGSVAVSEAEDLQA